LGIRGDGLSYAGNDDDLFWRGREAGFKIVYSPGAAVEHLIAEHRYNPETHREMFRMTGRNEFQKMLRSPPPFPLWLSVPRYFYSHFIQHLGRYIRAKMRGNQPSAFYHETQCIRFSTLIWQGMRNSIGSRKKNLGQDVTLEK
jgi:GT2 family glycosyltransferase